MDKRFRSGPSPHTTGRKTSKADASGASTGDIKRKGSTSSGHVPSPPGGTPNGSRASSASGRRGSGDSQRRDSLTDAAEQRSISPPYANQNGDKTPPPDTSPRSPTQDEPDRHSPTAESETRHSPTAQSETTSIYEPVDPEDFDTKSFFSSISDLSSRLQSNSMTSLDTDFDEDEMQSVVSAVTISMENFRNYTTYSQQHLERLRDQLKDTKDRMHKKIALKPFDPKSVEDRKSFEERQLEDKVAQLNKELAQVAEELARAQQVSADTEYAASQTALISERARVDAQRIQAEYEARKHADEEARRLEQQIRTEEERLRVLREQQETLRAQKEEERRSKLRRDDHTHVAPVWHQWPTFTYRIEKGPFDHGVGCIVRGDANHFRETQVSVQNVPLLSADGEVCFEHQPHEELVSNIIEVGGTIDEEHPVVLVMPHCTSRPSAMTREPVIKMYTWSGWQELRSEEATMDGYKDLKLVQALIKKTGRYVVVTRFKKDYLHFSKRGGKVASNVDPRIVITASRGTFSTKENFVIQIQPVDSGTVQEVRKSAPDGKSLLVASAVIGMEWTTQTVHNPLKFNIPIPPNPVKARKHAAARAAREAKRANPAPPPPLIDKEEERKRRDERKKESRRQAIAAAEDHKEEEHVVKTPTRWYMGQYGANEDDEDDLLYFAYCDNKDRWQISENVTLTHAKLDLVQFVLPDPHAYNKFMILRTKTDVESKEALVLTQHIQTKLRERICSFIIRQKSEDPYDVIAEVTHHSKTDKALHKLEDEGYDEGPGASTDFVLREGDHLGITFRANITAVEEDMPKLDIVFTSQLTNSLRFELTEVNKFLQRNYHVYRGFVQLQQKAPLICRRKPKMKKRKSETSETSEQNTTAPSIAAMQFDYSLVAEHLVSIPKDVDAQLPIVNKAPVKLRADDGIINEDTLRHLAAELGDEWQQLGPCLNVKRMRIQAILRNNAVNDSGEDEAKYDMLITWIKTVPKSLNKVDILKRALYSVGRDDLSEELVDMNEQYNRQRKGVHP